MASPTSTKERITSIDVLRGFSIFGILVINIWYFALPLPSINNPTLYGDFSGYNYAIWLFSHIFFELKFMTLFTILFGAGIMLFLSNKENGLTLQNKRLFWLFCFGLIHSYLIWYGDILVQYAICGLFATIFYKWNPSKRVIIGLSLLLVPSILQLFIVYTQDIPQQYIMAWNPPEEYIQQEIAYYQGTWSEQLNDRIPTSLYSQTVGMIYYTFWRISGLMLIGMSLLEWGILSNDYSVKKYRKYFIICVSLGFPLVISGVYYTEIHNWDLVHGYLIAQQFNYWGSLFVSGSYIMLIMLWCKYYQDTLITRILSSIGRTAFSNYILQSLIATSIFYGHGLGLFGQLERGQLFGIVLLIWSIQIILTLTWLSYYEYGPLEKVWKKLTYHSFSS